MYGIKGPNAASLSLHHPGVSCGLTIAGTLSGAGQCTVQPGHQCSKIRTEDLAFDILDILGEERRRLISRRRFMLSVVAIFSFSVAVHLAN